VSLFRKLARPGDAENDGNRNRKHRPAHRFPQQRCGKRQAEERLQQLQLANGGYSALRKAAILEDEADQHAEE